MKKLLAGLLALAFAQAAYAGPPPAPPPTAVLQAQASIAVTGSSARVALATGPAPVALTLYNAGSTDCYIKQGSVTVAATTSDIFLKAGTHITIWASGLYVAAITASSTTTLYIYESNGPIWLGP